MDGIRLFVLVMREVLMKLYLLHVKVAKKKLFRYATIFIHRFRHYQDDMAYSK